jgi:pimeloyl-ACP methyl ester carboxylesterase
VAFADAADRRVAAHLPERVKPVGHEKRTRARTGRSEGCFRTGVTAAYHDDIKTRLHDGCSKFVQLGIAHSNRAAPPAPECFTCQSPPVKIAAMLPSHRFLSFAPITGLLAAFIGLALPALAAGSEPFALQDCRISAGPGSPTHAARCGRLVRPLNPADGGSETIELEVAVIPALSLEPARDPLVVIAGGPGQSSIQYYVSVAGAFEGIRRERDIVLMDQRGTGQSAALNCPADTGALGGGTDLEAVVAQAEECLLSLDYDARYFTTSVAVTDLAALAKALGYEQLNVYGVSYGTRVAQHFLRRYPSLVRTLILDGVVPPTIPLGPDIAMAAQRALDHTFERCARAATCNARFPRLREDFAALKASLERQPALAEVVDAANGETRPMEIGADELAGAIRLLSYHPSTVALLPLLIDTAARGDFRPLASQLWLATRSLAESMSIGMHNSVICTEDVPHYATMEIDEAALEATYLGPMQVRLLRAICNRWPAGVIDDDFHEPISATQPVLLLSGEADPVTPPRFAEVAALSLANALHLVGRDQGHGLAIRGCAPRIMARFVAAGAIDDIDGSCLERVFAMPFFVEFSGPSP